MTKTNSYGPNSTPLRHFRVSEETWRAAMRRAKADGVTVSAYLLAALTDYASGCAEEECGQNFVRELRLTAGPIA